MNKTTVDKLQDLIYEKDGKFKWPTICKCAVCHGCTGYYSKRHHNNKKLATTIALIQHGYYLSKWEGKNFTNSKLFPYECKCSCKHDWNEKTIGNCLHNWTCKKCNKKITVDSSG